MKVNSCAPVLKVADLENSIAFYCDVLGFTEEFAYGEPPFYAGVKRNETVFHLCTSPENNYRCGMGSVYVFCDSVDNYYEEVTANGAEVTSPLNTYPYGMRDFQIKDPDGNVVCFGCEAEEPT